MFKENKQRLKGYQKIYCKAKQLTKKIIFYVHSIKMEQTVLILDKQCINKTIFHKHKHLIKIDKVDINRIVKSSKHSYSKKGSFEYFIGYITN